MSPISMTQILKQQETTRALKEINRVNRKYHKKEHQLQVVLVDYLRFMRYTVFAIPNGGSRNALEGANLKKEGVLAGVADLQILLPNGKSIFIEVKTDTGKQTPAQKDFEVLCKNLGHLYFVVRNMGDLLKVLRDVRTDGKITEAGTTNDGDEPSTADDEAGIANDDDPKNNENKEEKIDEKTGYTIGYKRDEKHNCYKICRECHVPYLAKDDKDGGLCKDCRL